MLEVELDSDSSPRSKIRDIERCKKKTGREPVFAGNNIPSYAHKPGVISADSQTSARCRGVANEQCVRCSRLMDGLTRFHMPEAGT